MHTPEQPKSLPEDFDPEWYSSHYLDVRASGLSASEHFLRFGLLLGRRSNGISPTHRIGSEPILNPAWRRLLSEKVVPRNRNGNELIVAVGHDASQTGAPNILLKLLQQCQASCAFDILVILRRGGILLKEYSQSFHVVLMEELAKSSAEELVCAQFIAQELKRAELLSRVILNTVDTAIYAPVFKAAGANVVTLVHELGSTIDAAFGGGATMQTIVNNSERIIFPSEYAKKSCQIYSIPEAKVDIIPYAVDLKVGIEDRQSSRVATRQLLGLTADDLLISTVGTYEPRKGLDLFIEVTQHIIKRASQDQRKRLVFMWKGPGGDTPYAKEQIGKVPSSLRAQYKWIDDVGRAEEYIAASDLFLLTSREESLGIVALEAACHNVPVILFSGCCGVEQILPEAAYFACNAFDCGQMASRALEILNSPADSGRSLARDLALRHSYAEYARSIVDQQFEHSLVKMECPRVGATQLRVLLIGYGPPPLAGMPVEGTGLRMWGLAKALAELLPDASISLAFKVSLGAAANEGTFDGVRVQLWRDEKIQSDIQESDVVLFSFCMGSDTERLLSYCSTQTVVLDCYVPIYTEVAARKSQDLEGETVAYLRDIEFWNRSLARGTYFLVANSNQFYYFTGILSSLGRLRPDNYQQQAILTVPYGIPSTDLAITEDPYRELLSKSDQEEPRLLWFGAVYPWFDFDRLLRALRLLRGKMAFTLTMVGTANPFVQHPAFVQKAKSLQNAIREHELEASIYLKDWVGFNERANWYCNADLIIMLNETGIENALSWRTRLADYVWSGVPVATNGGDPLGEELISVGAAARLSIESDESLANGLAAVLTDPDRLSKMSAAMHAYKPKLYWTTVTEPLARKLSQAANGLGQP